MNAISALFTRMTALAIVASGLLVVLPSEAKGEGSENSTRGDDLEFTVDSRWTGCEYGGYLPIRMRVVNHGPTRNLRIVLSGEEYDQRLVVERSLAAPQNAVVRTTLSVPMVGNGTYATIKVYGPDGEIDSLRQTVTMPRTAVGLQSFSPALLVVASSPVDFMPWREAMFRDAASSSTHSSGYGPYSVVSSPSDVNNQEIVPAANLPETWIDYTGLDIVAIPLDTFESLSNEQRSAIRKWIHSGGTLFLTAVGDWDENSGRVDRLLEANQMLSASAEWAAANVTDREVVRSSLRPISQIVEEQNIASGRSVAVSPAAMAGGSMGGPAPAGGVPGGAVAATPPAPPAPEFKWSTDGGVYRSRKLMLGTVYAFDDDPFPGSDADWAWWRSQFPQEHLWIQRQGFSSRTPNQEFFDFLIPGIRRFPVAGFLILITLFSVVIGPVNYFYFLRKRQLAIIVITIPLIAFFTSVSLFSYSALSHGFSVKSRTRSMTLIDQGAQSAITFSRNSLYAGFAPSEGLTFRPDTAVYPLWASGQRFENGRIDLTNNQRFYSGWFPSRTRTQFYTTTYEDQRARIDVRPPAGDRLTITNGFEQSFKALGIFGTDGKYYVGYDIPAGASAELVLANSENVRRLVEIAGENKPAIPSEIAHISPYDYGYGYGRHSYYGYHGYEAVNTSFTKNEINITFENCLRVAETRDPTFAPVGKPFYMGVLAENPGVDLGIEGTKEFADSHFVIGFYE